MRSYSCLVALQMLRSDTNTNSSESTAQKGFDCAYVQSGGHCNLREVHISDKTQVKDVSLPFGEATRDVPDSS